ncbi:unnamed protein product [Agarophyton chilense]
MMNGLDRVDEEQKYQTLNIDFKHFIAQNSLSGIIFSNHSEIIGLNNVWFHPVFLKMLTNGLLFYGVKCFAMCRSEHRIRTLRNGSLAKSTEASMNVDSLAQSFGSSSKFPEGGPVFAFVTGASRGLGLAIAPKLLDDGFVVVWSQRSVSVLSSIHSNASNARLDLAEAQSDELFTNKMISKVPYIDLLMNNAVICREDRLVNNGFPPLT